MKYSAWVQVTEYDEDFCFFLSHKILEEGDSSKFYTGATEVEALGKLLGDIRVGHPTFFLDVPIPESFGHVHAVRKIIKKMMEQCCQGIIPENLFWGGNWDVTFLLKRLLIVNQTNQPWKPLSFPTQFKFATIRQSMELIGLQSLTMVTMTLTRRVQLL